MPPKRGGYSPSSYDGRDLQWAHTTSVPISARLNSPAHYDQGNIVDCCTSMALATAFQILDSRNGIATRLAPLFHYFFARQSPQHLGVVTMRQALRAATKSGFCRLELHDKPIDIRGALEKPSEVAIRDAADRKVIAYDANTGAPGYFQTDGADRVSKWRSVLSQGYPVVAGIWLQRSYWLQQGMRKDEAQPSQGAHAVCIVGYDDSDGSFLVMDSRGSGFADGGNWRLSYEVASRNRIIESWGIRTLTYDD